MLNELTDSEIRAICFTHGYSVKEGQIDLKPYVFAAARAIIAAHEAQRQAVQEPVTYLKARTSAFAHLAFEFCSKDDGNAYPVYATPQPAVEPVVNRVLEQALQAMAPMRGLIIFDQAMQAVQDLLDRSHKNESLPTTKPMTQIEIDTMIDNFPAHSWDTDELIVRAVERHHGIGKA